MPLWDVVPMVKDGDVVGDQSGTAVTSAEGILIGYSAGWTAVTAEVDS